MIREGLGHITVELDGIEAGNQGVTVVRNDGHSARRQKSVGFKSKPHLLIAG